MVCCEKRRAMGFACPSHGGRLRPCAVPPAWSQRLLSGWGDHANSMNMSRARGLGNFALSSLGLGKPKCHVSFKLKGSDARCAPQGEIP
jgi:hypothetical protein